MYSVQDKGPQGWLWPVGITINQKKNHPYFSNSLFDLASINSSPWSWAPPWRKTPTGRQHAVSTQSLLQQRFLCILSHSLPVFQLWKISTICYTSAWEENAIKEHDSLDRAVEVCVAWLGYGALRSHLWNTRLWKQHRWDNPSQV